MEITPDLINSITDVEMAFGTERLLPAEAEIPDEFSSENGNQYTEVVNCIFYKRQLPNYEIVFKDGFEPKALYRAVGAHLASWGPKHEHKISGVAYLISLVAEIKVPDKSISPQK